VGRIRARVGDIRFKAALRPAHAPAPFQSGLLLHFATLTMLVRPANARALHFASLYPQTQLFVIGSK